MARGDGLRAPMRLAVTSDIHTDVNGPEVLQALVRRARELSPDVLLIVGDIATAPTHWLTTVLALRAVVPRLLLVAGNHDIWTTPEAVAQGLDSWARLDHLLPALAAEAGAEMLDSGPVVIDGIGFVGSLGWFDYSTREHLLDLPTEVYRNGNWEGLRWMDQQRAIWMEGEKRLEAEEVALRLRERLAGHLRRCEARKLVVATHMLAFAGQVHRKEHPGWRFVNAFMGSLAMGELIRSDPRVHLHVAGHTHLHSDLKLGPLRALVTPLGYRREWLGASPQEAVQKAMRIVEL